MTTPQEPSQPTPGQPPYARRAKESLKAFAAFQMYCEMGAARGLRTVARKVHKSFTLIKRWAKAHEWSGRVEAYDRDEADKLAKAKDEAMKAEAALWARRQIEVRQLDWAAAEQLRAKAAEILAMPIKRKTRKAKGGKQVIIQEPVNFSMATAARMLDVASNLSRLAAGVSTENLQHAGPDNQPLAAGVGQVVILQLPDNGRKDLPPE